MLKGRHIIPAISALATVVFLLLGTSNCYSPSGTKSSINASPKDSLAIPYVSVKVADGIKQTSYTNEYPFTIICTHKDSTEEEYFSISEITVKSERGGMSVYDANYGKLASGLTQLYFKQTSSRGLGRIDGTGYRGRIFVVPGGGKGTLSVINRLDVESYLKGVLPAEMGIRTPDEMEALKAQAIASRTYAMYKLERRGQRNILDNTILDQVYIGYDKENELASSAIDSTAGEVLMYDNHLIPSYYFAVCGGKTESVDQVWGNRPVKYSGAIDDGDYCSWAHNYFWNDHFSRELLQRRLNDYFKGISGHELPGVLKDIKVINRSNSGRVKILKAYTSQTQAEIKGDKIRWAIRTSSDYTKILPSTLFDIDVERDNHGNMTGVRFIGRGNGHGTGMCQCGAIGRARAGQDYREILSVYYPNTEIEKIY